MTSKNVQPTACRNSAEGTISALHDPRKEVRRTVTTMKEISRTIRAALAGWPETARLIVIITVLTTAFVVASRLT